MAEKLLHTRIQLKYDTLANWNASSFKLKAGELAIVTLGEVKDGSAEKAGQHPVLFKVGTGEHTFTELPFASALAADVYAWAKAKDVVLEGKVINFKNAEGTVLHSVTLNYVTETEVNNILKSYSTTEEMNAAIKVEADRAKGVEGGLDTRIKSLEDAIGENGSVATQIQTAIEGLDSSATQTAGADGLALGVTLVDGKVTAITGSIAANTYDAHGAAAAAEGRAAADATSKANAAQAAAEAKVTALADGAVKDNADAIDALEGRMDDAEAALGTVDSRIEAAITDANLGQYALDSDLDAAVERIAVLETADGVQDGLLAGLRTDVDLKAAQADLTTEVNRAKGEEARIEGLVTAEATKAREEEGKLDARLVEVESFFKLAEGESLDTALDTLVEIQKYLDGEGEVADQMLLDIAANKTAIENEVKRADAEEKRLAGLIEDNAEAIEALGITDGKVASAAMADKANSLTDAAKDEVKAVKVDNAVNADKATNADKAADADKLGGVVASNYALKTDAQGYANQALADAKAYADQAELDAVATAKSYTDGREVEIKKYADQAEADAISSAKDYTDEREVEINKYVDQAELDAIASAKEYTDGRETAIKAAYEAYADQAEADAKAYADGLAKNYATAAQGAKADSALQSIEAGTGLKVSAKADNKQTIDIDESVVFVFDCGSATKLID